MVNAKAELKELEIPAHLVTELLKFEKSEDTWKRLIADLKNISAKSRVKVIEMINANKQIEDKKEVGTTTQEVEKEKPHKYKDVQIISEKIMKRERQILCYEGEPASKEHYQEFDERVECSGDATYVCHHCGRNLCSQHSYWIPDQEFPYLAEKLTETEKGRLEQKVKIAGVVGAMGFMLLVFGGMLTGMIGVGGIALVVLGFLVLIGAIYLYLKAKVGLYYPTFLRTIPTKWDRDKQIIYEHKGYYTAVHCWECLKTAHEPVFRNASTIFSRIYEEASSWKRRRGRKRIKIPEYVRYNCAIYAANRYLNEMKFGLEAHIPLTSDLRLMVRPDYAKGEAIGGGGHYGPTPVWLFWPAISTRAKRAPSITSTDWVDENRPSIRRKYGILPAKLDRKKQRKVIKKKNKMRVI